MNPLKPVDAADVPAAAAAAAAAPVNAVEQALIVCEADAAERQVLMQRERFTSLNDFARMLPRDIDNLAAKLEKRPIAQGRIMLPSKVVKNIQALCYWAQERRRRALPLDPNAFDGEALNNAIDDMTKREAKQTDTQPTIKPGKFNPADWNTWYKQFLTYLSHVQGAQYAPLDYVVRPEPPLIPLATMTQRIKAQYDFPLFGKDFVTDNHTVYRLLSDLVNGTPGFTWISPFDQAQDGRSAWQALTAHYDGGGQKEKRTSSAAATIRALHYKNESVYSFEEFSRGLLEAFRDLDHTEEAFTPYQKVKTLLLKIEVNHPRVEYLKGHVQQNFKHDIDEAVDYLSTQFAELFADAQHYKRARSRHIGLVHPDPQRPRLEEDVSRRPDGTAVYFGVDVTDVSRTFSNQEMSDLGPRGQAYVFQERARLGLSRGRSGGGSVGTRTSGTSRGGRSGRSGRGRGRGGSVGGRGQSVRNVGALGTDDVSALTAGTGLPPPPPPNLQQPSNTAEDPSITGSRGARNGSGFGAGAYHQE